MRGMRLVGRLGGRGIAPSSRLRDPFGRFEKQSTNEWQS